MNFLKKQCMLTAPEGSPSSRPAVPPASGAQFPKPKLKIPSQRSQASDGDVHFAGNSVRSLGPHPSILTGLALKIIMGPMLFFRWNPRKESFRKLWGPRKRGMARLKPGKRGMARLEPWEGGLAGNKQWKKEIFDKS